MASKYWVKLYHEMLHDPKMGRLGDHLYRRTVECFLMAGEQDEDGWLPSMSDMAWTLRTDLESLEDDLMDLAECGIVRQEGLRWFVCKFARRQAPSSDTERQQRKRERDRKAQYNGHKDVTIRDDSVTEDVTSREVEPDTDTEKIIEKDTNIVADATPPDPPPPKLSPLEPETPGEMLLFEMLVPEFAAKGRRAPKRFKSLACKAKFTEAENRLSLEQLRAGIKRALEKSILSITGIVDFVAKWHGDSIMPPRVYQQRPKQGGMIGQAEPTIPNPAAQLWRDAVTQLSHYPAVAQLEAVELSDSKLTLQGPPGIIEVCQTRLSPHIQAVVDQVAGRPLGLVFQ